jgi:uncharacterized protein (TIGR02646 family)
MTRLPNVALPPHTAAGLAEYQAVLDAIDNFSAKVKAAKVHFSARNRSANPYFREVRRVLREMCTALGCCCYCGLSQADEIEHVWPKDFYPEKTFEWSNYVYSCGPCNGPKSSKFAVFRDDTGGECDVGTECAKGVPPPSGFPLLINPRAEDPLEFLEIDIAGTFLFLPRPTMSSREIRRAQYTIDILRLNTREVVVRARENAFRSYRAMLCEYISRRSQGEVNELLPLQGAFSQMPHPAVWSEMKRQRAAYVELRDLFDEAPEAVAW